MSELSGKTLMAAVQAVHAEMRQIQGDMAVADLEPDDQELLLSYSLAAAELKTAYLEARERATNLPRYEDLTGA